MRKISDARALTVIFNVRSWKCEKKSPLFYFILFLVGGGGGDYDKTLSVYQLICLAIRLYQMSPGMPKEAGSLNGPLCDYLMRQNPYNRTRSKS